MSNTFGFSRKTALRTGAGSLGLALALAGAPAFAQDAKTPAQADVQNQTDGTDVTKDAASDIVVTGTLFRRANTETPSPVTVLTSDTLAKAGITNINDAIRSVSADNAGSISTGFQNGFSAGGAAVSLRGLGVSSTLVLIDGLRSTNFPLNDDGHNAYVDLNSIPFSIVDRVDVLKDGASSTYGADAIGGVVNLILKKQFNGIAGQVEGGISERGDAGRQRANLTVGYGDYDATGFNIYANAEYQHDGAVSVQDRYFPYNSLDLSRIGGLDQNTADSSLTTASVNAVVRQTTQADLNNPLTGGATATGLYQLLGGTGQCTNGTFTVAGAAGGTGCRHDNTYEFAQIQPKQERYSFSARASLRLGDDIEAYSQFSYSHDTVVTAGSPRPVRNTQPFGGSPTLASSNPGIALPVYICASGVNCATAADRRLNPNNPYAANNAATPTLGAARLYYLFGDIPFYAERENEVYRSAAGITGSFGEGWDFRVEGVYAKDNFKIDQHGYLNIAGLLNAINTGAYNFLTPSLNSQAVRNQVAPVVTTGSYSALASLEGSLAHTFADLPGGPLQVLVGGQVRREVLNNRNQNANLATYGLTTSSARGRHTVSAAFFEIDAPLLDSLDISASGRYDHYSEGYSHFSPKIGAKFTPIKQFAVRGTFSKGFRAPTFAESSPSSQYAGFSTFTPPASFAAAHGGSTNPYAQAYSLGTALTGNPNLKPEISRSFTGGVIFQPVRWFSMTVDYYNVRKTDIITAGPDTGTARTAYYAGTALPAGYTVNLLDAADPLFPAAPRRVLIINAPFVNSASLVTEGLDVAGTAQIPLGDGMKFTSRIEVTDVFRYDLQSSAGAAVQKYVGTLGPYELSSGAGTPKFRGNWQNTLDFGKLSLTSTVFYVSRIKSVAADEIAPGANGQFDLSCANATLYSTGKFCYIKAFWNTELNGTVKVNDNFTFSLNVSNLFDQRAPLAPASYSGTNYLPTWHYAGIIGRQYRAGASFKF